MSIDYDRHGEQLYYTTQRQCFLFLELVFYMLKIYYMRMVILRLKTFLLLWYIFKINLIAHVNTILIFCVKRWENKIMQIQNLWIVWKFIFTLVMIICVEKMYSINKYNDKEYKTLSQEWVVKKVWNSLC